MVLETKLDRQYIDGIQPPGMIFGEVVIKDGAAYLANKGKTIRLSKMTIGQLQDYSKGRMRGRPRLHPDERTPQKK